MWHVPVLPLTSFQREKERTILHYSSVHYNKILPVEYFIQPLYKLIPFINYFLSLFDYHFILTQLLRTLTRIFLKEQTTAHQNDSNVVHMSNDNNYFMLFMTLFSFLSFTSFLNVLKYTLFGTSQVCYVICVTS